jgi:hypothetical protein
MKSNCYLEKYKDFCKRCIHRLSPCLFDSVHGRFKEHLVGTKISLEFCRLKFPLRKADYCGTQQKTIQLKELNGKYAYSFH